MAVELEDRLGGGEGGGGTRRRAAEDPLGDGEGSEALFLLGLGVNRGWVGVGFWGLVAFLPHFFGTFGGRERERKGGNGLS